MVGLPFDFNGSQVHYSVGNPMGAYTSWAAFTLSHHFLIYTCCVEAGVEWSKLPYAILGDDIVICDEVVAEIY